jgi:DNA-binding CsgD family transcriptional regulator
MLLERDAEQAALDAAAEAAATGSGRLVLIEGPAGIGKSGLLAGLRERTALRVLAARASELEGEFAFGVVRQLFEGVADDDALAGAAGPAAAVLGAPGESDEGVASFAALHGLYWLAANLAAERPLLLAIDDLHWCDRPSLRFLAYLARRLEGLPILVAATLRTAEPGTDPGLLAELEQDPTTLAVRPGPLSAAAVAVLVRERLGADADDVFCAACHDATGGNPLLLRQLLRALEAEAVTPVAEHIDVVRAVGPRAASATVLVRLRRLSADAAAVARAVAVLGESATVPAVAALAGLDEGAVAAVTRTLVHAEILRPEPPLGFVHPLVRDAVHHELTPVERALQHERAAGVLRDQGAGIEQIAAQVLNAPGRGDTWAVDLLDAAGHMAMRRGAGDSAVAYWRRALAEPPPDDRRGALLLALGGAEMLTNGPAATEHLLAGYERLDDPVARAGAARTVARALLFTQSPVDGAALAGAAAAALPPGESELRDLLEAFEFAATYFGAGGPEVYARMTAYRALPGPGVGAKALAAFGALDWAYRGGDVDTCSAIVLAALADGAVHAEDDGLFAIGPVHVLRYGDRDEARTILEGYLADAHRRGAVFTTAAVQLWLGAVQLSRGDLAGAEELLRAARELQQDWGVAPHGQVYVDAHLALVHVERGDPVAARRALERSAAPDDGSEAERFRLESDGLVLLGEGRWEEAAACAERLGDRFARITNPAVNGWRSIRARALARLGRADEARALLEAELSAARTWGAPGALGRTLRHLAELEGEAGLARLEEAVARLDGSVARLEHAKALAALGTALRLAQRPTEAREPLRAALELAAACDAPALAEHVRTELYATGARPRTDAAAGPAALTASERRVADLAAAGQTNRDIAQALFVTPKTVEVHLSNAYRKLDIRSRRELPTALGVA